MLATGQHPAFSGRRCVCGQMRNMHCRETKDCPRLRKGRWMGDRQPPRETGDREAAHGSSGQSRSACASAALLLVPWNSPLAAWKPIRLHPFTSSPASLFPSGRLQPTVARLHLSPLAHQTRLLSQTATPYPPFAASLVGTEKSVLFASSSYLTCHRPRHRASQSDTCLSLQATVTQCLCPHPPPPTLSGPRANPYPFRPQTS